MPDVPAWWADSGGAGWIPDAWWGTGTPWVLAGLVRGSWRLDEPGPSSRFPFPGVLQAQVPASWFDTLAVDEGSAGWDGFDAALARVKASRRPPTPDVTGRARPITDLVLSGGSSAYDETGLWIRRGVGPAWMEGGATNWDRGGVGDLALAGRHAYGFTGAWAAGRHRFRAGLAQRGAAGALSDFREQAVTGLSGALGYARDLRGRELSVTFGQAYDHHESFGGGLDASRRDARGRWVTAEWGGDSLWSGRVALTQSRVTRQTVNAADRRWSGGSGWVALRMVRRRGPVGLEAALGAGRETGTGRNGIAPSLAVSFAEGPFAARFHVERVLTPVWSDLAPGQEAFLQRVWAGGFEADLVPRRGPRAHISWRMGRARDRAIVARLPLDDLWLRQGYLSEPVYDFGLATVAGEWRGPAGGVGGEVFGLLRDRSRLQPNVDPGRVAHGFAEVAFRAFAGDLGVKVRGEVEAVGPRESEQAVPGAIPGYASAGAAVVATLADATITLRMRNLEDHARRETWVNLATGEPALGPGREFRLTVGWRLFN